MTHLRLVRTPPHRHPVVLNGDLMHLPANQRVVQGRAPQTRQARLTNDQFWPSYWPTVCGERGILLVYDGTVLKAGWCGGCADAMDVYAWGPCDVSPVQRCPVCGQELDEERLRFARVKYCGPRCRGVATRRAERARTAKPKLQRTCPHCRETFETVQPHKVYCTRVCQRAGTRLGLRKKKEAAA